MAIDFDSQLADWSKSPRNIWGVSRHYGSPLISLVRRCRTKLSRPTSSAVLPLDPSLARTDHFETQHDLRSQGWGYIDKFFSEETHRALVRDWPKLCLFAPPRYDFAKSYDIFPHGWSHNRRLHHRNLPPSIRAVFELLFSDETARLVTELANDGVARVAANVSLSWARHGHYLLPHRDSNAQGDGSWINFIIFVDGGAPALKSGGTSFFQTNTFQQVLFSPASLRNTAIFYDTRASFYHGFPPVSRGEFSKRIICNYASHKEVQS